MRLIFLQLHIILSQVARAKKENDYAIAGPSPCSYETTEQKMKETEEHVLRYRGSKSTNFPPIRPGSSVTEAITATIWVTSMPHVQEYKNSFSISGGIEFDIGPISRLKWNPKLSCGLNELFYTGRATRQFWDPLFRSDAIQRIRPRAFHPVVWFRHNGYVGYDKYGFSEIQMLCQFNPKFYPFDVQLCEVGMILVINGGGSIALNITQVTCYKFTYHDLNPTWMLHSCTGEEEETNEPHRKELVFKFLLSRRATYVMITVIAPTMILANTNSVIFLVPAVAPEKASIGLAFLLAYFVYIASLKNETPAASEQPYFYYYLLFVLILNCIAIFLSAAMQHMPDRNRKVERINRRLLIFYIFIELGASLAFASIMFIAPMPICQPKPDGASCIWGDQNITTSIGKMWD